MIRRVPVHNAVTNQQEVLEGEVVDQLKEPSVFVDPHGKTYDASKGIPLGALPTEPLVQLPRTTWYAKADDVVIVGYRVGARGCAPIYEGRIDEHGTHARSRPDALGPRATLGGGRDGCARHAARALESLAVADPEHGGGGSAE